MAISLLAITPRSERRLRLSFTNTLAGGAFGLSPALYTITCENAAGGDPDINAALIVSGSPNVVELALSESLVDGGRYTVSCPGVPAVDLSVTPSPTSQQFVFGDRKFEENRENNRSDADAVLFGRDLVWSGSDFIERANGDLALETGPGVVYKRVYKISTSEGLPWDANFGAHPQEYVDAPPGTMPALQGTLQRKILEDDRVTEVKVELKTEGDETFFTITPTLLGNPDPRQVTVNVK